MKTKLFKMASPLCAAALLACSHSTSDKAGFNATQFVNPFAGTGDHGHVFLGANVPFGMVQLGPSQFVKGWDWCSGYHWSDSALVGFSHTHLSGTGIGDLGDITFFPFTGKNDSVSAFSRDNEVCRPGYYNVLLDDSGVEVELTATTRTGFHKYSFPESADTAFVKVDLKYGIGWDRAVETSLNIENDSTISGYRFSRGWAPSHKVFFSAVFSSPIVSHEGDSVKATLAFTPGGKPLLAKVGISPVSVANARENLTAENNGWDFNAVAEGADLAWNNQLSKVKVDARNETDLRKFYTALYHTMFAPAVYNDVNGDYRAADGTVANTGGKFTDYTIFSLWDTYRAAHPLATIIHPELQNDYAETFIDIYRRQGKLPVWHLHGNETNCMVGNPGVIVLGDLVMKGLVSDNEAAYEAMKASMMLDERSLTPLREYGYIPYDSPDGNENVAKGMEYAIAAKAVADVATKLGKTEDAVYFSKLGESYREYFDPVTKFMRGKSIDGKFREGNFDPFSATHRADDYCEGNAWQYIWLVPQNPRGLMSLFGSEDAFVAKLDSLFTVEGVMGDDASPDISGLIGQYAHGNEPSHHTVYLYNYAGVPAKAAPLLRRVMNELYNDDPAGICGNEDVGQMSAWFVLSSMGLYQVEPSSGKFVFGTPLFNSAKVSLGDGKELEIIAHNNSDENIYIQNVTFNGSPYDKSYIDYSDLKKGGKLEFNMGPKPSADFGTAPESRP